VVGDGARGLVIPQDGIGRAVQGDGEGLIRLEGGVPVHEDGDGVRRITRRDARDGTNRYAVAGRRGGAIGAGVVHRDGLVAGVGQLDREVNRRGAAVALVMGHLFPYTPLFRAVVGDGARGLVIPQDGIGRAVQGDGEGLIRLEGGVPVHEDGD